MIEYNNIRVIGTSHISSQSVREVKENIENFMPDIVALELDPGRLHALLTKKRAGRMQVLAAVGLTGFVFASVGEFVQKLLGKVVDMTPGKEMLTAVRLARKKNLEIALIDQDIAITLRKFSKRITGKEKLRFVWDIVKGMFSRKEELSFDLSKVPPDEIIGRMIGQVRERYPSMYSVLIEERNHIMANNLLGISFRNPGKKILAVVGAGHLEGIEEILKEGNNVSYSFS